MTGQHLDRVTRVKEEDGYLTAQDVPRYLMKVNSTFYKSEPLTKPPELIGARGKKPVKEEMKFKTHSRQQSKANFADLSNLNISTSEPKSSSSQNEMMNASNSHLFPQHSRSKSKKLSQIDLSVNMTIDNKCGVCYDEAPDCIFLKCGHAGVCYECGLDLWEK
jgi:hypothetical protein